MVKNLNNKIIHFWLDHLEIFGTFKYENDFFDKLDFDNSNYSEFEDYTITKSEVKKYKYKIIFTKNNYTLFSYYKWLNKKDWVNIATKDYICIYSTAFKLLNYQEIFALIKNFELKYLRRFDICIDFNIDIEKLLKFFKEPLTWKIYKKSWRIETKYFWEIKNSLNKRQIIRIYDKFKDIVEKKKLKLYEDYLEVWDITRVELEVRQELAKNVNIFEVFDNWILLSIFKNYIWKYSEILDIFENIENKTLYKKKGNKWDFQWNFYKIKKYNIFVWFAKNLYEMWFCPVRILIWEEIIQEQTKKNLWFENIHKILKREKQLKQEIKDKKYFLKEEYKKIEEDLDFDNLEKFEPYEEL